MPADQAAGLRRRTTLQPLRCIHAFFDAAESLGKLAQALHQHGWTSLLVDTRGRVLADAPTRSLFDWRQQIARGQLHTQPMLHGDGWYAPGIEAGEPALMAAARGYDCLLFDASPQTPGWAPLPGAVQIFVIEVSAARESVLNGYALLKTLCRSGAASGVGLVGDANACGRLREAAARFLDPAFARSLFSTAHEDDAFAALAVRMVCEETSLTAC